MQHNHSIFQLFHRLWVHMPMHRRWQFSSLLLLMVTASFAEIISIGAVMPFLGVLTVPTSIFEHKLAQPFIHFLNLTSARQLLLPLTVIFGVAVIAAGVLRLLLLWTSTKLSFAAGADFSNDIYRRTLYQPYAVHVARNSSEVIAGISAKSNGVIYSSIIPALNLISGSILLTIILVAMFYVDPFIALVAFGGFGLIYVLIIRFTRKQLIINSQCIAKESVNVIKCLQEGLGGIRDVLIDGSQAAYCQIYRNADIPLRRAQGNNLFVSLSPRYGMEALGMLLIALLAYTLALQPNGIAKAIPILGALALGAQRLLPVLQQAYAAWTSIQGGRASLEDTLELLDQSLPLYANQPAAKPMIFNTSIALNQVSFRYSTKAPWIIRKLNITIKKGSRVGVIGTTGSGKSTLLDIIMGLLSPTEGFIAVDGQQVDAINQRTWQLHIAHVPQAIFLADSSIAENIAFGIAKDDIDLERVKFSAQQAQIADVIETWPSQYQTFVGERGIRLSGGQRQRIAIARALYKQADVIIFDEATSALDNETEQAVMEAIDSLSDNLTIIIIAHRLTTLKNCTQILELEDGFIKRIGRYDEII